MKIILHYDDDPEVPSDVMASIIHWLPTVKEYDTVAAKFEMASGIYWAYKTTTKTGTWSVDIRTEWRY